MGTIAQLERSGMDWDDISDISDNLSPEDEKQYWAVSRAARKALVPTARWGTEYRLLLAERYALKAERDNWRDRAEGAWQILHDMRPSDDMRPGTADSREDAIIRAKVLLEYGEMEGNDE